MMFHPLRAVCRRPRTAEALVQPRFELLWTEGRPVGQGSFQVFWLSPVTALHPLLLTHIAVADAVTAWQLRVSLNNPPHNSSTMSPTYLYHGCQLCSSPACPKAGCLSCFHCSSQSLLPDAEMASHGRPRPPSAKSVRSVFVCHPSMPCGIV